MWSIPTAHVATKLVGKQLPPFNTQKHTSFDSNLVSLSNRKTRYLAWPVEEKNPTATASCVELAKVLCDMNKMLTVTRREANEEQSGRSLYAVPFLL